MTFAATPTARNGKVSSATLSPLPASSLILVTVVAARSRVAYFVTVSVAVALCVRAPLIPVTVNV